MTDYQALWLPLPGVLFQGPETTQDLDVTVSCKLIGLEDALTGGIAAPPSVLSYQCSVSPVAPSQLDVSASATGVRVLGEDLSGLFSLVYIDCLRLGHIERFFSWDELPSDAEEIIDYRPSQEPKQEYQLTVYAYLSDGEVVNAVYSLIIHQDWTAGRDRLRGEVNARSNKKG